MISTPTPPKISSRTVIELNGIIPATKALAEKPFKDAVAAFLASRRKDPTDHHSAPTMQKAHSIEAISGGSSSLVAHVKLHPFVGAAHLAFNDHRPLVLSPDAIWLLIAQGFASHVNANAEALRSLFVQQHGKASVVVERNDLVRGAASNPWREVFTQFSDGTRGRMNPEARDLLLPKFSTSGADELAAAEIVFMDTLKSYFSWELVTVCGIPKIILEGTIGDWEEIAKRARRLAQYELSWWTDSLIPILDEFVAAARGNINEPFWRALYKTDFMSSGGPYVNGWINGFFPYLNGVTGLATNPHHFFVGREGVSLKNRRLPWWMRMAKPAPRCFAVRTPRVRRDSLTGFDGARGATTRDFPSGLSRAPFRWICRGQRFDMQFMAGFIGVSQHPNSLELRPQIGWLVSESM